MFLSCTGSPRTASPWGARPGKGAPGMVSLGRDGAAAFGFRKWDQRRAALWAQEASGLLSAPSGCPHKGLVSHRGSAMTLKRARGTGAIDFSTAFNLCVPCIISWPVCFLFWYGFRGFCFDVVLCVSSGTPEWTALLPLWLPMSRKAKKPQQNSFCRSNESLELTKQITGCPSAWNFLSKHFKKYSLQRFQALTDFNLHEIRKNLHPLYFSPFPSSTPNTITAK